MPKTKRVSYDNAFKLPVVEYAEIHGNHAAGRKFGVSEKCARDWRKNKDKIIDGPKGQKRDFGNRKRPYHELERDLSVWLMDLHRSGKVVSKNAIRIKARELGTFVKHRKGFKASDQWYKRFMKSQGIYLCPKTQNDLKKVKEEMETDFDSKLVETDINKETEDIVREETDGFKVDLEEFQKVKSVNSVTGDDDNVEYNIYIENTDMANNDNVDSDDNTDTVESDGPDSFWEDIKRHKNTEYDVIKTPKVSVTSGEQDGEDMKPVLSQLVVTEPGKIDKEVKKTSADPGPASNEMEIIENSTSQDQVMTKVTDSSNRSDVREKSDGVYHITLLVSSEQEDAVRLLFRDKNWQCLLKVLSDDSVAGLIKGGFESIFPLAEKEKRIETNAFTEIKSPVDYLDDIDDELSDNQSHADDGITAMNKKMDDEHHKMCLNDKKTKHIENMTEPSFIIVKTERNGIDEIEDLDSSIQRLYGEGMFGSIDKPNEGDTNDSVNGKFKEESDGFTNRKCKGDKNGDINRKTKGDKKGRINRKSEGNSKGGKRRKSEGEKKGCMNKKPEGNDKGGIKRKSEEDSAGLMKRESNECTGDSMKVKTKENTSGNIDEQSKNDENTCSNVDGHSNNDENTCSSIDGQSKSDENIEKPNNGFKCTLCATSCMTNIMLKEHFEQQHPGCWLDYYCKDCFERFKTRQELWKHRATAQHAKAKDFASFKKMNTTEDLVAMGHIKCELCGKFYTRRDTLRRHLFDEHGEITKFTCTVCGEEFVIFEELQRHKREAKHSTALSKIEHFQCESCGKFMNRYDTFRSHKQSCLADGRTIEEMKNIPCDICGAKFISKTRLNSHKRVTHCKIRLVCDICGDTCKSTNSLRQHKLRHDPKNRKFSCDKCGKAFFTKAILTEHKRTHTKEKPFQCHICSYRCAIKQNMYKHFRNVHKTQTYGITSDPATE